MKIDATTLQQNKQLTESNSLPKQNEKMKSDATAQLGIKKQKKQKKKKVGREKKSYQRHPTSFICLICLPPLCGRVTNY
jgi:hypothetical protein